MLTVQTQPAQNPANRGHRHAEVAGDLRPAHPLPPQPLDFAYSVARGTVLAVVRRRAAVTQACRSFGAIPRQPTIALPRRYPGGLRRLYDAPTRRCDALDQQESTLRRQPRILWMFIRAPAWVADGGQPTVSQANPG